MTEAFVLLEKTRLNILTLLDRHSIDQLNKVPSGYNNNLIWNAAHVLVTQQLLTKGLTGMAITAFDKPFIEQYRKGSTPQTAVSPEQVETIKTLLKTTAEQLKADYGSNIFGSLEAYPTSYGYVLHTVEDAIMFNNTHEGLHLGYMMAMSKNL